MKKLLCVFLTLSLCTAAFSGCASDEVQSTSEHTVSTLDDGAQVNDAFNTEVMTTLDGTTFLLGDHDNWFAQSEMGFGITNTEPVLAGLNNGEVGGSVISPYAVTLFYIPKDVSNKMMEAENLSEEEQEALSAELSNEIFFFTGVCRLPKNDKKAEEVYTEFTSIYSNVEKIATAFDSDYYLGYNDNYSSLVLTDEEKSNLNAIIEDRENFKNKIFIFPASEVPDSSFAGSFTNFETTLLTEETVTQDVFADYDMTVVNVWATWCNPCISEMPELAQLDEALPENVNLISLCIDGSDDTAFTQEILDYCGVKYPVLMPSDSLRTNVIQYISSVPTTFFIDKEGNVIGNPVVGVPGKSGEIKAAYLEEINARLELIR